MISNSNNNCYKLLHVNYTNVLFDFDETLHVGSCEHLEQIPTVMVTFVKATFVLVTFFLREANCHEDIHPGNFCPGDIANIMNI